jgi:hypothetical protein
MLLNVFHRKQSGLDDQPNQDKEIVPPFFVSQKPITKQQIINRFNPIDIKGKWSNQALEEAMDAIERRTTSFRKPNRHWNIPLTSLSNHLYGKTRSRKLATSKYINNRRLSCSFLGFGCAGCWDVNKPTKTEDENGKTNPNKANTFPRNIKNLLVVLL